MKGKKKYFILLFILVILFLGATNVFAAEMTPEEFQANCDAIFGNPGTPGTVAYYIQLVLNIIKYVGVVLVIVLTVVDFVKALLGEEKDMYKPLARKAIKRTIYAVLLFLMPSIVKGILTLIDVYGTCGIA
jgi:hypothetical protein